MGFIRVPNEYLFEKGRTAQFIAMYGTDGFTIWCYLKYLIAHREYTTVNMRNILDFFGRVEEGLPTLKDKRALVKRLEHLRESNIIDMYMDGIQIDSLKNISVNKNIIVYVNDTYDNDNFEGIGDNVFDSKFNKCGHIAWSLYCVLCRLNNEKKGYAYPSIETLCSTLGYTDKPVYEAIRTLEQIGMVRVERKEVVFIGFDKFGRKQFKQEPNNYFILMK